MSSRIRELRYHVGMHDPSRPAGPPLSSFCRTARSFRFAAAGIVFILRTQPNARVHVLLAAVAVSLAAWLRLSPTAWAVLLVSMALVLALEAINTAIEFVVELASPQQHELARAAKDTAAAAVLIAALMSVGVGLCLFLPPLLER